MAYHYSTSASYASKKRQLALLSVSLLVMLMLVLLGSLGYYYREQITSLSKPMIGRVVQVKAWIASQKKKKSKGDAPIMTADNVQPVHFEFYATLPQMEVNAPLKANVAKEKNLMRPFSRDELVQEFAEKLDETTLRRRNKA